LLEGVPESAPPKRQRIAWCIAALAVLIAAVFAYMHFREKAPMAAEKLQFRIIPSVKLAPYGSFAVSPNGRYLAFAGLNSDGDPSLWVHDFKTDDARVLPGTESSILPPFFWSHDSRFIAYDSGRKLNKIDINSGKSQKICDIATMVLGGSWNRDGTIIFGTPMGVMRVSDAGGAPTQLTRLKPEEWDDSYPAFLPDGQHFLYYHSVSSPASGIYVGSLYATPEEQCSKQLVPASTGLVYVPSQGSDLGQLLYVDVRDGTLKAQAFDDKQLKLAGIPATIADQIGFFETHYPFFSASANGVLVYRGGGDNVLSRATWFDRQGKQLGPITEPASFCGLSISPNEKQVAASLVTSAVGQDLYLYDSMDINKPKNIFAYGSIINPIWSPDSNHIVFSLLHESRGIGALYQKPVNGSKKEELLWKSSENLFPTSWSRDGRFLLYQEYDPRTLKSKLWVLSMEGDHKPKQFLNTEYNEIDGHFSPNGQWIAYMTDISRKNEVYVCPFPKTQEGKCVSKGGGIGPRWGRDGKELYYRTSDGKIMVVKVTAGKNFETPEILFPAPPDLSGQAILFGFPSWDVTPDGNKFLIPVPVTDNTPSPFTVILNWQSSLKK
jgi:eukaryotic-like serine/threonine-protein kinase